MPQLKLETNLPVIFLTLLVIAIVVLGYLELKKIHERLKVLEYHIEESKKVETVDLEVQKAQPEKENFSPVQTSPILERPQQSSERVEQWQMDNSHEKMIKENIIETLNKKDEYIEEIDDDEREERVVFGGAMFPHPQMMYQMMGDESEQIIEQISRDQELTFDTEEGMTDREDINHEGERDTEDKEGGEDEEESDVKEDESESGETEGEEIDFKEIPADDDFEKEKIVVDESYSVNELKTICKNLGLQHSGNKTTLINRIMDNQ